MNLFRSEEHVRRWADFNVDSTDGIKPVREMAKVFSNPLFTERLNENYVRGSRSAFRGSWPIWTASEAVHPSGRCPRRPSEPGSDDPVFVRHGAVRLPRCP